MEVRRSFASLRTTSKKNRHTSHNMRLLTLGAGILFLLAALMLAFLTAKAGRGRSAGSAYFNDDIGFNLVTAAGWLVQEGDPRAGRIAVIRKSRSPDEGYPEIVLRADPLDRYKNSPSVFGWHTIENNKSSGSVLVEPLS